MRVAVIDDGVNSEYFGIGILVQSVEVTPACIIRACAGPPSGVTHGTVCAGIIRKYAPSASIISVKVMSSVLHTGRAGQLIKALEWCAGQDIGLINMSVGSREMRDFASLQKAVAVLLRQGKTIVAASANGPHVSWPAFANGVIGVRTGPQGGRGYSMLPPNDFGLQVSAQSEHGLPHPAGRGGVWNTQRSNSYAAPYITALAHNYLMNNKSHPPMRVLTALAVAEGYQPPCFTGVMPTFLDCALVVAEPGTLLYPAHFAFSVGAVLAPTQLAGQNPSPGASLLVACPVRQVSTDVMRQYAGVACAGLLAPHLKKRLLRQGCLVWDEACLPPAPVLQEATEEATGPVYLVYGSIEQAIGLAKGLAECMLEQGYRSEVVSDVPLGYLYGFYPCPSGQALARAALLFKLLGLSCVLYCSCGQDIPAAAFDGTVYVKADGTAALEIGEIHTQVTQCNTPSSLLQILEVFETVE